MTTVVGLLTVLAFSALPVAVLWVIANEYRLVIWCTDRLQAVQARRRRRHFRVVPLGRPIEQIALDVRRLSGRVEGVGPGTSYAKFVATQRAYDDVLVEGCRALGVPQRLLGLPEGPARDLERRNIEFLLEQAGLRLRDVA